MSSALQQSPFPTTCRSTTGPAASEADHMSSQYDQAETTLDDGPVKHETDSHSRTTFKRSAPASNTIDPDTSTSGAFQIPGTSIVTNAFAYAQDFVMKKGVERAVFAAPWLASNYGSVYSDATSGLRSGLAGASEYCQSAASGLGDWAGSWKGAANIGYSALSATPVATATDTETASNAIAAGTSFAADNKARALESAMSRGWAGTAWDVASAHPYIAVGAGVVGAAMVYDATRKKDVEGKGVARSERTRSRR